MLKDVTDSPLTVTGAEFNGCADESLSSPSCCRGMHLAPYSRMHSPISVLTRRDSWISSGRGERGKVFQWQPVGNLSTFVGSKSDGSEGTFESGSRNCFTCSISLTRDFNMSAGRSGFAIGATVPATLTAGRKVLRCVDASEASSSSSSL